MQAFHKIKTYLVLLLLFSSMQLEAQSMPYPARKIVQFSGVLINSADLQPIPYASITIKGSHRGTTSNSNGFFSFVAIAGETVLFRSVGFMSVSYKLSDTLSADHYSIVQSMVQDTIELTETVIYPWPTKEKFREAFVSVPIPEDDATIMRKNFDLAQIRERAKQGKMDGSMNYKNMMQDRVDRLYYSGQIAPNNLLNPFAWAQFIKKWNAHKEANKGENGENGKDYEEY
ncbi:MAG: carboxypeptidase-like regulatory domain-containing protein [Bacteroidales bacterium]